MIRIKFSEPDTPLWNDWVADCKKAAKKLVENFKPAQPFEITDLYKPKKIKQAIYLALDGPFKGRCAFCESPVKDFQRGDIEHFRPKKGVTDEKDVPVQIRIAGKPMEHPGYFWLAYNWRNLLLSCITCNQPGDEGIGKRLRFPVANRQWAANDGEVPVEKPLLFNPIDPNDEDPEDHLGIELATGIMFAKNNSERAKQCIEIFGLNKRTQLVQQRQGAIREIKAAWTELLYAADEPSVQRADQAIQAMERGDFDQTLARRAYGNVFRRRIPKPVTPGG